MAERTLSRGEYVFRSGEASSAAYVVDEGEVELVSLEGDTEVRIALLGPSELFGEMGLVEERPHTLSARATRPTRLSVVGREEFLDMLLRRPEEGLRYLRQLFERLRAMNARVVQAEASALPPLPPQSHQVVEYVVRILGASEAAERVLPPGGVTLRSLPFRIGRLSEKGERSGLQMNDLDVADEQPYTVSRHHLAIEREGDRVFVQDRGSHLGTMVNGEAIGGRHKAAERDLALGENQIALGGTNARYRFRVLVARTTTP